MSRGFRDMTAAQSFDQMPAEAALGEKKAEEWPGVSCESWLCDSEVFVLQLSVLLRTSRVCAGVAVSVTRD